MNQSSNEKAKRKRKADALGRLVESSTVGDSDQTHNDTAKLAGRGSIDGWTSCPLCGKYSKKKYALGRGIAAHLHAIHTPWKPTNLSRKIARRQREEQERQNRNQANLNAKRQKLSDTNKSNKMNSSSWTPTQAEIEAWDLEVLQIMSQVEQQARDSKLLEEDSTSIDVRSTLQNLDRTGKHTSSYRDSLPAFLKAAAEGDLNRLKDMVSNSENKTSVQRLLDTNDRHLSTAEHWAAGGGHLECLMFLSDMRRIHHDASEVNSVTIEAKTVRRRDGKTCLHYAARNGHLVRYASILVFKGFVYMLMGSSPHFAFFYCYV
jgi:ankyrin repeat protein